MRNIRSILFKIPGMLTCKEFEAFVIDYLVGDLPILSNLKFWIHLKVCKDCRSYLKAYMQTVNLEKSFFENLDDSVPVDMPDELVESILKLKKYKKI